MPPARRTPAYIPSARAKRLARSLREHRERAELDRATVSARLGWSPAKIGHLETGRNKPSPEDVGLLLDIYGVSTPERDGLVVLACEAERRGWWTDYVDLFGGPYVALEDEAEWIGEWAPQVIPGLLQTPEYAVEVIQANRPDADPVDMERRLRARANRQLVLTRKKNPVRLDVIIDQPVLERDIGGRDVMRDQLYRLRAEAERPNVVIQVLPTATGTHAGLDGQVILLRSPEPDDPLIAYAEGYFGAVCLENPHQVRVCMVAFDRIREAALDPEQSAAMIEAAAKR